MCLHLTYIHSTCNHIYRTGTYTCHAATLRAGFTWNSKGKRQLNEEREVLGFDRECERYVEVVQEVRCGYGMNEEGERGDGRKGEETGRGTGWSAEGNGWCWECRERGLDLEGKTKEKAKGKAMEGAGSGVEDREEAQDRPDFLASDTTDSGGSEIYEGDYSGEVLIGYARDIDDANQARESASVAALVESTAAMSLEDELESLMASPGPPIGSKRGGFPKDGSGAEEGYDSERDLEGRNGGGSNWEKMNSEGREKQDKDERRSEGKERGGKGKGFLRRGRKSLGGGE